MIIRILERSKSRGEEIDIDEGMDLYKQLAKVRRLFHNTIEGYVPANVQFSIYPLLTLAVQN
jgi:hypothetical protein